MGMVVFRLKGDCSMTEALLKKLNSEIVERETQCADPEVWLQTERISPLVAARPSKLH